MDKIRSISVLIICLVTSILTANGQGHSPEGSDSLQVGGVPVMDVLRCLGAGLERDARTEALDAYASHFDRMDTDRDGRHTRVEYVDNGGYMTPQARAGIFRAADGNADGIVTQAEYVLNRIITDEAKTIVQKMDDDKDGLVERAEFVRHAAKLFSDSELAEQVYAALDVNSDGGIPIPEYLRIWGQWARLGQKPAETRIAAQRARLSRPTLAPADPKAVRERLPNGDVRRPLRNRQGPPGAFAPNGIRPGQAGLGRLVVSGLEIGKPFPAVNIFDADGKPFSTEQLKGQDSVLVAGCLTCPAFLRSYRGVEAVHRDYAPKGVKFYYVYRALAHPENNRFIKPFSLQERLMHIDGAQQRLKTQIPWLADSMNNDFKKLVGNTNNAEFLLDCKGRIVYMQMWSNGDRLRAALEAHVGPVERTTTAADLGLPPFQMQPKTGGTVVPRIEVPNLMVPLKIEPKKNNQPFYVKLRAEAEPSVLEKGQGKLYLGFHIDPIYKTHWNNLVDPIHFDIDAPADTKITPPSGDGPRVEIDGDCDPREFLVTVDNASPETRLSLTVRYFACSDDPAWCRPVQQAYVIHLVRDAFGGAVLGRGFVPGGPPSRRPGPPGRGRPSSRFGGPGPQGMRPGFGGPPSAEMFFSRFDRNNDGKLTEDEVPAGLWQRLKARDANGDGLLTREESRRQ